MEQTTIFDGATVNHKVDTPRLSSQLERVKRLMLDGKWRTLPEIQAGIKQGRAMDSEAAISARLRDLRKQKFGGYVVERRRRGGRTSGFHEYRLTGNKTQF